MRKLLVLFALLLPILAEAKVELTASPQVGLSYTTDWRLALGGKFLEAGNWNSSFMVTAKEWEYGISVTRRLSDKLPVASLQIGVYGVNFFSDFRVGGIISVDL
jgi:hypothetical protein